MNIIICAATEIELGVLLKTKLHHAHQIQFNIHGAGMLQACYEITNFCISKPDLIIQCGIAGAFDSETKIGTTWLIKADQLGDCGAEDKEQIIQLRDMPFFNPNTFPFEASKLINNTNLQTLLPNANAITVNTCSGNEKTIAYRKKAFNAQLESMEGAALHYVCLKKNIPFLQIRSVSNFIEPRNTANWNIALAIQSYSCAIEKILMTL
jgi:futalosine hydrolase